MVNFEYVGKIYVERVYFEKGCANRMVYGLEYVRGSVFETSSLGAKTNDEFRSLDDFAKYLSAGGLKIKFDNYPGVEVFRENDVVRVRNGLNADQLETLAKKLSECLPMRCDEKKRKRS